MKILAILLLINCSVLGQNIAFDSLIPKQTYRYFEKKDFVISKEVPLNGSELFSKNNYLIEAELLCKSARNFGFKVTQLKDKENPKKVLEELVLGYNVHQKQLYIDRIKSSKPSVKDLIVPLKLVNKRIKMQIIVSKDYVRFFANNNEVMLADSIVPSSEAVMFSIFTKHRKVKVESLKIWDLEQPALNKHD